MGSLLSLSSSTSSGGGGGGRDSTVQCIFPLCSETCSDLKELTDHMADHHIENLPDKKIKCLLCNKSFHRPNKGRHMRGHTGYAPYACKFCGKGYSDQSGYNNHQKSCSLSATKIEAIKKAKRITCDCGKSLASRSGLYDHQRKSCEKRKNT